MPGAAAGSARAARPLRAASTIASASVMLMRRTVGRGTDKNPAPY